MNMIKDDLQFILENKSKAKIKEKLLENSFSGSISNNYNANYLNESDLNNSVVSTQSKGKIKSRYNLKEKMDNKNLTKFQEFLNTYKQNKNVLLLVDSKSTVWELVKRSDLSVANLSTMENISSLSTALNLNSGNNINNNFNFYFNYFQGGGEENNNNYNNNNCYFNSDGKNLMNNNYDNRNNNSNLVDEKLLNIEIKENEDKSFANSELDISKVTDFNISALIRDTQNNDNISDIN